MITTVNSTSRLRRLAVCLCLAGTALIADPARLLWKALPELPPPAGAQTQFGVAGPFAGVHNDALIVAGGANFPQGLPWEKRDDGTSPPKIYRDDIYVLVRDDDSYRWVLPEVKLPSPIGYGVAVSTDDGVVCIGGEWKPPPDADGKQTMHRSDKVYMLAWDPEAGTISIDESFPSLPRPVTAQAGAKVGNTIHVTCGDAGDGPSGVLWALNLEKRPGPSCRLCPARRAYCPSPRCNRGDST